MRSIRLSLVVYFLLLLGLALGAVSGLVYWLTYRTVEDRRRSTHELILTQAEERERQERAKFDETLLFQARTLANLSQWQNQWQRMRMQPLYLFGMLTASTQPSGYALLPVWAAESLSSPLAYPVQRMLGNDIRFPVEELPHYGFDDSVQEYYQINTEWGIASRSESLAGRSLPFQTRAFSRTQLFDWKFDDFEFDDRPVRRVTLKAPLARFRLHWHPSSRRPGPPSDVRFPTERRPPFPPQRYAEGVSPTVFIQCAADTTQRDKALTQLAAERDAALTKLDDESRITLQTLRRQLLLISALTFAATVLGGYGLVRLGLAPLRRLSDAVSRVSIKDFRLSFSEPVLSSELRPIVERLTETLELLRRAFAREKQAAADISHELRTPLTALLTILEVALRKERSVDEYRDILAECRNMGQHMSRLVERLLALARLDAGVDLLKPQPVDVAALADQCAALVRPLAEARDVHLEVQSPRSAYLVTDPDKLREIITNLLHNAIEYNQPNGNIALLVEEKPDSLLLEVRDTGIGIPPEVQPYIFERFYRADPARSAESMHAGLGLAIVKGYIDLMGGQITCESQPQQGTRFRVQLPTGN
ncbi:MAG: sensor histidine kinase [Gemmataceae bacterium]